MAAKSGPIIVVLDEFPWFAGADPSLEGELQVAWDQTLEHLPVLLILIGSDITMMARLNEHDRPLFGRLRPMLVSPLNPTECAMALSGRSSMDAFDSYLITGGFPRLLSAYARFSDSGEFVRESLRDELSELVVTARLRLYAEFADAGAAYRILSAIGAHDVGQPGFNDVVSAISDPGDREAAKTATTRALTVLTGGKRLVDIERPAMASASSKLRRYRISDPYLRFWFRFVESQVDLIARGRADIAIRRFDAGWTTWRGRAVESVIVDGLTRLAADHPDLREIEKVQAWWNRDHSVEVDLVAQTVKNVFGIGTIKWRANSSVTARNISELAKQRDIVPHAADAKLIAVTPTAPVADTGADIILTSDDLIKAWPT